MATTIETTETTEYATGEWVMLFEGQFGDGPDGYWCIEQDPEGFVCVSNNAETRTRVDDRRHMGGDRDRTARELRESFAADGVPAAAIERYMLQAGLPDADGVYP